MFDDCTNMLYAPKVLPANDFKGSYNYQYMFRNCTSLITAPELPATRLGSECYQYMFYGCTSLVNAPELPATTLTTNCYNSMFYGCTSLKTIRCHAKVTANNATVNWLNGVKTSGIFYGYSEYGWSSGASGIPTTWTFEELTD